MEKKLQELTEKIYSEGIGKAKEEAEKMIAEAQKASDDIIGKAKREADKITADAKKKADEIIRNGQSEMKLASNQAISAVKQKITDIITAKVVKDSVSPAAADIDFMKKLIEISVKNFFADTSKGMDLALTLPENESSELEKHLKANASKLLNGELKIEFSGELEDGFRIGPADGSYKLSFTDKDFENFFKQYMKPKTIEFLFGGK